MKTYLVGGSILLKVFCQSVPVEGGIVSCGTSGEQALLLPFPGRNNERHVPGMISDIDPFRTAVPF